MINTHPAPGLLCDSELDEIVEFYTKQRSLMEIDEQARALLAQRGAVTDWERESIDNGVNCFTLGNHRVAQKIAIGESYNVMLAQHLFLGRVDVVKVIRELRPQPAVITVHLRKLHAQASLTCAHVVRVYDVGCQGGAHFAAAEHVMGIDLRNMVRNRGPLPMDLAATIFAQAAIGLDAVHALGYVYGILQPNKILVAEAPDARAKLCDAGSGLVCGSVDADLRNCSGRMLDFLAPEIITGEGMTVLSDVYSLGSVLYYAVTSKVPFPGGTAEWKRDAHLRFHALHPKALAEGLDDSFIEIIASMMAKEPSKRPQSMRDVVARLQPWVLEVRKGS